MLLQRTLSILVLGLVLAACSFQPTTPTQQPNDDLSPQFTGWQLMGGGAINAIAADSPQIATDGKGNQFVAFVEYLGNDSAVIVKRWVADHWEAVGQPLTTSVMDFGVLIKTGISPHLVVDELGNPVVAFAGQDESTRVFTLIIRRWNGSSWQDLGSFPGYTRDFPVHQIAFDSQNNLIVARVYSGGIWLLTIDKLTDDGWTTLFHGEPRTRNIKSLALALDATDRPILAYVDNRRYVKEPRDEKSYLQYLDNGQLIDYSPVSPINAGLGKTVSVSLTGGANPAVAWTEEEVLGGVNSKHLFVKQWNGSSWVFRGSDGSSGFGIEVFDADNPSLATNARGDLAVVYQEIKSNTTDSSDVYYPLLWNSNTNGWDRIGGGGLLDIGRGTNGKDAAIPRLALEDDGTARVAWQEEGNIYAKQFLNNSFASFGAALDKSSSNTIAEPSITIDNRLRPAVAWTETVDNFGSTDINIKRWLGTAWSATLPVPDSVASNNTYEPSIKVEKSSVLSAFRPVVAFSEELVPGVRNIMVRRWNGASWTDYGTGNLNNNPANNAVQPSLALNSSNRPVVAWIENFDLIVKTWTGSSWQQLGSALDKKLENNASNPSIAIDSLGRVLVAWEEYDFPNTTNIHLKRWDGTSWTFLGDILDRNPGNNSFSPSLVIDSNNQPVVAWHESVSGSYNVYAKRWNGSNWLNLGGFIDRTSTSVATYPVLAMGTDNNPVISWDDSGSIYVKRWNPATSKWVLVSTKAVDGTLSQIATFPSITLDASNKPIVAYQKAITASNNDVLVRGY